MLIGGDDITNYVITPGILSYTRSCFRFALIGGKQTA